MPSPNFENSISGRQAGLSAVDGGNGGGIAEERGGAHCRQWLFDWRAASPRGAGQLWPRVGKPRRVLITTCVIVGLVSLSTYFLTKNITAITNKLVKCAFLFQKISICHYTRKVYDNIFKIWIYWPCLNYIDSAKASLTMESSLKARKCIYISANFSKFDWLYQKKCISANIRFYPT